MAHVLQLSTELLQQIAEYGVDVTTLRLVCKTFDRAFFDAFANEYLRELKCFLLDKKRLHRLITILSRPYLARKVQKVLLSLDPLESKQSSDIPVALLPHFEDQFEIGQILARMSMLESKFEPYMRREPPAEDIALAFRHLRTSSCPYIALDCRLQTLGLSAHLRHGIEMNANDIILNLLQILLLSKCSLSEILLSETFFLDQFARNSESRDSLSKYSQTITSLTYEADLDDLKRVFGNAARDQAPQILGEWAFVTILRGVSALQELHLSGPFDPRRVRSRTCMDFSRTVLNTSHFWSLRKAALSCIQCATDVFWVALNTWKGTIEDLALDTFSLETETSTSKGDSWTKTFQLMLACPQLRKLCLNTLYERGAPGDASPSLDLRCPNDVSVANHCYLEGHSRIQSTLRFNVEMGSTFSYKVKGNLIRDRAIDEYAA